MSVPTCFFQFPLRCPLTYPITSPFPQGGGLDTMVLSPDEELLLLVTPKPKAVLMTREFDPIAEVDVDASQDDGNQVRSTVNREIQLCGIISCVLQHDISTLDIQSIAVHERGLGKEGDAVPRQRGQSSSSRLQALHPTGRSRRQCRRWSRQGRLARRRSGKRLNRTMFLTGKYYT